MKIGFNPSFGKFSQIVASSVVALAFQSIGLAQGNLVNFYGWTAAGEDPILMSVTPSVISANSAEFLGGLYANGYFHSILTGNIDTTPGATYEISFTMQNVSSGTYVSDPEMSFGSFNAYCDLLVGETIGPTGYNFSPQNYDFTVVAADPITTMSFNAIADSGQIINLWNVSVSEVPEPSFVILLGLDACALVLARKRLRRDRQDLVSCRSRFLNRQT